LYALSGDTDGYSMLNLPRLLSDRDEPVRTGVIGAGLFGTNLIHQLERAPGLSTAVVADIDPEKAKAAFTSAGVPESAVASATTATDANAALASGDRVVLDDGLALTRTDVDVVVEATGLPEAGARHAYTAINEGRHVVMVTVEADTVVGPILADLAERAGVTYSMAYGDQPALICELVDWAETAGFEVVAAGKGNPYRPDFRHGAPDDIFERLDFDAGFVADRNLNPRMYNSFYDGTKVAVEMCAVANATGLEPDVPGMHLPIASIPEIPEVLRPESAGGILSNSGVVETIATVESDGSPVEEDISFGVYVVVRSPDGPIQSYLNHNAGPGFSVASDGEYAVFCRPYHLPGVETGISVANAAIRNEPTGVPRDRVAEVVGGAKRDLTPGDVIDGGGGSTVYGKLVTAGEADAKRYVPFELLEGAEVTTPIATDEVVTADAVSLAEDSFLFHLRSIQDST
ncbi:MAG: hypothetical protein R3324_05970, partial [Halobacteriales archaeon]|nr:hypothetical protein [Halobacteriales archaeon]